MVAPDLAAISLAIASRLQSRTASRLPLLRSRDVLLAQPAAAVRARDSPPFWGSCSLEHVYAGCPFSPPPRPCGHSGVGEGRQAFTGAVLRVLAPLDGFGCACGTHEPLARPAVSVRPNASRPCFMPLAPFGVALQSFPFSRSRTRSRGPPASLWVRARLAQRRGSAQGVRGSFRLSRRPLATAGLAARRTE